MTYVKLSVKPETKEEFLKCVEDFKRRNPEFKTLKITEDFMVRKISEFYLRY